MPAMPIFTGALLVAFAYLGWRHLRLTRELEIVQRTGADANLTGHYVEIDCAACHRTNRVAAARFRSRPICGACKARLMPGRRIAIVHAVALGPVQSAALNATANDYDRFWFTLDAQIKERTGTREALN